MQFNTYTIIIMYSVVC